MTIQYTPAEAQKEPSSREAQRNHRFRTQKSWSPLEIAPDHCGDADSFMSRSQATPDKGWWGILKGKERLVVARV